MTAGLPELPEGYFFRISEGWFFGPTVRVQLRHKLRWLPFSIKHDDGWSTREIMGVNLDSEVALGIARRQARLLANRLRPVDLRGLEGDHR